MVLRHLGQLAQRGGIETAADSHAHLSLESKLALGTAGAHMHMHGFARMALVGIEEEAKTLVTQHYRHGRILGSNRKWVGVPCPLRGVAFRRRSFDAPGSSRSGPLVGICLTTPTEEPGLKPRNWPDGPALFGCLQCVARPERHRNPPRQPTGALA